MIWNHMKVILSIYVTEREGSFSLQVNTNHAKVIFENQERSAKSDENAE
jgi:hypothetical protein